MHELALTRTPNERRLYSLEGVGTLRLDAWPGRSATAEAAGRSWRIGRRGFLGRIVLASDVAGTIVGEFRPAGMRRGGPVSWEGRDLTLRPASMWRERYALADGERELAVFDGRGRGRRPVRVTVGDLTTVPAGLLLFAAYVVRGLAEEAGAAAGSTAATTAAVAG